jgi:cytochrome d ubiquinol oxidase subunit I
VRRDEQQDRFARGLSRFIVYYFSFGATFAIVGMTVLLPLLWGRFWSHLALVGWIPLVIEAYSFICMVTLSYLWYFSWDRLRAHRKVHLALGGLLVVAAFLQVNMIDVVAAYMLTPAPPSDLLRVLISPTVLPLDLHRNIGNVAYIGFAAAAFCAVRFLRARRTEDRAFYDWAGQFGLLWGIAFTLVQPLVGWAYAKEIQLHAYRAWYRMMLGDLAPVFLLQITVLGLMFVVGSLYMWRRLQAEHSPGTTLQQALFTGQVASLVLAAQPYQFAPTYADAVARHGERSILQGGLINPLGAMIPFKGVALLAFIVFSLWGLSAYLAQARLLVWGSATRGSQRLLMASAGLVVLMIVVMGYIRENGRFPDLVVGQMQEQGQQYISGGGQNAPPPPTPPP